MMESVSATNNKKTIRCLLCLVSLLWLFTGWAEPTLTAFTYQGQLTGKETPANGLYDFQFSLHEDPEKESPAGKPLLFEKVEVADGRFSVSLDFGPDVFNGQPRWLEIAVRQSGEADFTILTPRQALSATPYATYATYAPEAGAAALARSVAPGAVTSAALAPGAVSQLGAADGSPLNALQVNTNGLVGIGTSTPAAGLDIRTSQTILTPQVLFQVQNGTLGYTNLNYASSVSASGNLLAISSSSDSAITLVNISNPSSPTLCAQLRDGDGAFTNLSSIHSVQLSSNLLAVAAYWDNAVTLVSVTNPATPVVVATLRDGVGEWNELGNPTALALSGNLLAIAAYGDNAVTLADISNPAAPVLRSVMKQGQFGFTNISGPVCLALSDTLLAIGGQNSNTVTLVDVTNPGYPLKRAELRHNMGSYTNLYYVSGLALRSNLLAVAAAWSSAVTLVDVSNPANPVWKAVLQDGVQGLSNLSGAYKVALSMNRLAVSALNSSAVSFFDVTDMSQPRQLTAARSGVAGTSLLNAPQELTFCGTNLAVASSQSHSLTLLGLRPAQSALVSRDWVGIGTASPQAPLHVLGNVVVEQASLFDVNADALELGAGARAVSGAAAIGTSAQAAGTGALALGPWATASGINSVALGYAAEASGAYSQAFGCYAKASGDYATAILGTASGDYAVVGGGLRNTASGTAAVVVGGGFDGISAYAAPNSASGTAAVVGGGLKNTASGYSSTIPGGEGNVASGYHASVPGGYSNSASAYATFAAGSRAKALHPGTFVWSDPSSSSDFASTASYQFLVRATGGMGINKTNPATALDVNGTVTATGLAINGNANITGYVSSFKLKDQDIFFRTDTLHGLGWYGAGKLFAGRNVNGPVLYGNAGGGLGTCSSTSTNWALCWYDTGNVEIHGTLNQGCDRNLKENFAPVDSRNILEQVVDLPLQTWRYKTESAEVRHLGPVAQDFHATFALGEDDRHIATIDAEGVALAAIQGLNQKVEAEQAALRAELKSRDAEIAALKERLAALEQLLRKPAEQTSVR